MTLVTLPETSILAPENGWLEYDCRMRSEEPVSEVTAVSREVTSGRRAVGKGGGKVAASRGVVDL